MSQKFLDSIKPKTAKAALARWDSGQNIFSVEMGGLGPGYEQAIQVLVFEIIRDWVDGELPSEGTPMGEWANETIRRVDERCGGFSGAQVGAAKHLAYKFLRYGYRAMLEKTPDDRLIQVSNFWPRASAQTPVRL